MIALFLKLILAHVVGDFVLQPKKWVEDKQDRKWRSPYLYGHVVIHLIVLAVLLQFDTTYWKGILLIAGSHLIIDVAKLNAQEKFNQQLVFLLDQIAHLGMIAYVVWLYTDYVIDTNTLFSNPVLLMVVAVLMVTYVVSVLISVIISKWDDHFDKSEKSLKNAGKFIGMLERLFVFGFVIIGQWQAIGFLLAAKSVFRFGDLSNADDRKLTEYVLIGTLLSFGMAIIIGLAYKNLLPLV